MKQSVTSTVPCLLDTWANIEKTLYHWLNSKAKDPDLAFDLLQETFIRALLQDKSFCDIDNQKAWLFRVAGNLLTDEWRKQNRVEPMSPDDFLELTNDEESDLLPVDGLVQCLPTALSYLNEDERQIIEFCDLQGHPQQEYSAQHNLPLSTVKSRIQRARIKLGSHLKQNCQIHFDNNNRICCFSPKSKNI